MGTKVRRSALLFSAFAFLLASACASPEEETTGLPLQPAFINAGTDSSVSSTLVLVVTAPDLAVPFGFNLPIVSGVATGKITLPTGSARQLLAVAYAADGTELQRGSLTLNVTPGANPANGFGTLGRYGAKSVSVKLSITGATPTGSVKLNPPGGILQPGSTSTLAATVLDANGKPVTGAKVVYASMDPARARVDQLGHVTPLGSGTVTIAASYLGATGTVRYTVKGFGWLALSRAGYETCGIRAQDGSAWCWGAYQHNDIDEPFPLAMIGGGLTFSAIATGSHTTCALTTAGDAYCWGDNLDGGLGDSTYVNYSGTPHRVTVGGAKFLQLSTTGGDICGATTTGLGYCWGGDPFGAMGLPDVSTVSASAPNPLRLPGGDRFVSLSAGSAWSNCGTDYLGFFWCWGRNDQGQLGVGDNVDDWHVKMVAVAATGSQVASGGGTACALFRSPTPMTLCWGSGNNGALGIGTPHPASVLSPNIPVPLAVQPATIAGVGAHFCVAGRAGALNTGTPAPLSPPDAYCWGYGGLGLNGDGAGVDRSLPSAIPRSNGFDHLDDSGECAVTRVGVGYCWGEGFYGPVPTRLTALVPQLIPVP
jgi:hypothetical protein